MAPIHLHNRSVYFLVTGDFHLEGWPVKDTPKLEKTMEIPLPFAYYRFHVHW